MLAWDKWNWWCFSPLITGVGFAITLLLWGWGYWVQQNPQNLRPLILILAFLRLKKRKDVYFTPGIIESQIIRCGRDFEGGNASPLLIFVAIMGIHCFLWSQYLIPFSSVSFWGITSSSLGTVWWGYLGCASCPSQVARTTPKPVKWAFPSCKWNPKQKNERADIEWQGGEDGGLHAGTGSWAGCSAVGPVVLLLGPTWVSAFQPLEGGLLNPSMVPACCTTTPWVCWSLKAFQCNPILIASLEPRHTNEHHSEKIEAREIKWPGQGHTANLLDLGVESINSKFRTLCTAPRDFF